MKSPCSKTCPNRKVGCHGVCEDYLKFNEQQIQRRKKRLLENECNYNTYQSKKRNLELRKKLNRM